MTATPPALEIRALHTPELDPGFLPAALWTRAFERLCREHGGREVTVTLLRPDGSGSTHRETLLPAADAWRELNLRHLERTIKFLLWARGGSRIVITGAAELLAPLQRIYSSTGARAFDVAFMDRIFGDGLTLESAASPPDAAESDIGSSRDAGMSGCRIGFDLGGSDRKCAAIIDGKVVFSEEVAWDPYFQEDPDYHYQGILDSLRRAAAHLPRVDAIGGSAAGVYVDSRVRAASLFRGVPEELFKSRVENLFLQIAGEWGGVPIKVVNDGDVTALAGSMSLGEGGVLGIAMGTSTAAGYVDAAGAVTGRLSELAFVPVDHRPDAPVDEWSGDHGCAVQYFSQQGFSRLIAPAGLPIDPRLPQREQLVEIQEAMAAGDERAAAIYRTLGTCFGYFIPQCARFYEIKHLLLLGRALSGEGGELLLSRARDVLSDEFPELAAEISIRTPDEKMKRHGQAIAAASLPQLR